jgi:hypothetical protein
MQQTLLALLALLIATLLSFNQQQAQLRTQQQIVRAELQQMALGVAKQTMEVVRAQKFDEEVGSINIENVPEALTSASDFGKGACGALLSGAEAGGCEAVEQFHNQSGTVPFDLPDRPSAPSGGNAFNFEATVKVYYVCSDMERASEGGCTAPTRRKEVVVEVQDQPDDGAPRLQSPVTFSEVLAFS